MAANARRHYVTYSYGNTISKQFRRRNLTAFTYSPVSHHGELNIVSLGLPI